MSSPVLVSAAVPGPQPPRLLDQLREAAFGRFARREPGERYVEWVRRFILFHGKRHPRELGAGEAGQFLEHVAQSEKGPLRCLEQAREALTFLYQEVLRLNIGELPLPQPPRLLDRVRHAARVRHYSPRTARRAGRPVCPDLDPMVRAGWESAEPSCRAGELAS